jgi:hypothetical protein
MVPASELYLLCTSSNDFEFLLPTYVPFHYFFTYNGITRENQYIQLLQDV